MDEDRRLGSPVWGALRIGLTKARESMFSLENCSSFSSFFSFFEFCVLVDEFGVFCSGEAWGGMGVNFGYFYSKSKLSYWTCFCVVFNAIRPNGCLLMGFVYIFLE